MKNTFTLSCFFALVFTLLVGDTQSQTSHTWTAKSSFAGIDALQGYSTVNNTRIAKTVYLNGINARYASDLDAGNYSNTGTGNTESEKVLHQHTPPLTSAPSLDRRGNHVLNNPPTRVLDNTFVITDQTLSASPSAFCGSGAANITLASSQVGINYTLRNNAGNTIIAGPISGTGAAISFNTGTISATTTYNVLAEDSHLGAIGFNGNGGSVSRTGLGLEISQGFTVEGWIYLNSINNATNVDGFVSQGQDNFAGPFDIYVGKEQNLGKVAFWLGPSGSSNPAPDGSTQRLNSNVILKEKVWSHVACVYDATNQVMLIYINGVLDNSAAVNLPNGRLVGTVPNSLLLVGKRIDNGTILNGKIDDVRIWNTVRTAEEIAGNMNTCNLVSKTGLVIYYPFDDAVGSSIAVDASGNGFDGTLTGLSATDAWTTGNLNCVSNASVQMSTTQTVTVNALPSASITGTNSICAGQSTTLTATGGATYSWNTEATTAEITVSPAVTTTYTATVTNAKGCVSTVSHMVTVNALPSASITGTNSICAGQSTTLTATGGATYSWNTGATTAEITVSPAATTTYTATVTNAKGCVSTVSHTVTVNALPSASITGTNSICAGQSTTLTAAGGATYFWNTEATTAEITVSPAADTKYKTMVPYMATVTSAEGCVSTASLTVTVNALPTVNFYGPLSAICEGKPAGIGARGFGNIMQSGNSSNVSGIASYFWNTGATTSLIIVSPAATTEYTVTVTDVNGCVSTASYTVTVNANPAAPAVNGAVTVYAGSSATLQVASGASSPVYNWYNMLAGGSSLFTGADFTTPALQGNTTYYVDVTDANGCTSSRTAVPINVTIINDQTLSASPLAICGSGAADIVLASSQVGINYTLRNNAGNTIIAGPISGTGAAISFNTGTISSTTTYNVLAEDSHLGAIGFNGNGGSVSRAGLDWNSTQGFTVEGWIYLNALDQTSGFVSQGEDNLAAPVDIYIANGTVSFWAGTTFSTSQLISNSKLSAGIWNHLACVYDATNQVMLTYINGMLNSSVSVSNNFEVGTLSGSSLLVGKRIDNGTILNGKIDDVRIWNTVRTAEEIAGNMNTCNLVSKTGLVIYYPFDDAVGSSIAVDASGNGFDGTLTGLSATGAWTTGNLICVSNASVQMSTTQTVTVNALPSASITGTNSICAGQSTTLTATGGATCSWNTGATTAEITVSPAVTTTYTATVTSAEGCVSTVSHTVTVNALPSASITGTSSICAGQSTTLTATGGATYSWNRGATTAEITVSPAVTTTYTATVTNAKGCVSTLSHTVTVNALPSASITGASSICAGQSTTLTATGGATYSWNRGATTAEITVSPAATTTYTATVTSAEGCVYTANYMVAVNPLPVAAITAAGSTTKCPGNIVTLTANTGSGYSYQWYRNGMLLNGATASDYNANETGLYTVMIANSNGCTSAVSNAIVVTIEDVTAPVPRMATLAVITGQCSAKVTVRPTATDACSGVTTKATTTDPLSYNVQGTYTIHWTFTDSYGNRAYQNQTVIVKDNVAPVLKKRRLPIVYGACSATITTRPTAKDNCAGVIIGTTTNPLTYHSQGRYRVRWTFSDGNGNTVTQFQLIIVLDKVKPILRVPRDTISIHCAGSSTLPVVTGTATASDNCGTPNISYRDRVSGSRIIRTWKATDAAGNYSTGIQVIRIVGLFFSPSIRSVPTSNIYTGGNNNNLYIGYGAGSTVLQVYGLPSDRCIFVWSGSNTNRLSNTNTPAPVFTPSAAGYYTFTVTVINRYGCRATATISICVTDIRVPGIIGKDGRVYICYKPLGSNERPRTIQVLVRSVGLFIKPNCRDAECSRLGSCNQAPCKTTTVTNSVVETTTSKQTSVTDEVPALINEELKVTVMPNPSTTFFTLKLESKYETPVSMRVMDERGRIVDAITKISANGTIQIGHNYSSGIYYVELIQGGTRKIVKMIKARG